MKTVRQYSQRSWYNGFIHEQKDAKYSSAAKPDSIPGIHQPHDKGYKSLLSSKKVFLELLRSFVKKDWIDYIDENSIIKIDKSYISADFRGQESDLVYQVKMKDKREKRDVLFYVLLELQSENDYTMLFRILSYMMEIWRDILKNDQGQMKRDQKLPVIIPIVLYNGVKQWTAEQRFKDKLSGAEWFGEDVLDFSYILIDIQRYDEEELLKCGNLISSVFALEQANEVSEIIRRLGRFVDTIKNLPKVEWNLFWSWTTHILSRNLPEQERNELSQIVQQSNPEEAEFMITNIERIVKRTRLEDHRVGKLEGKFEGKLEVAARLISLGMTVQQVAQITELSEKEIQKL